jgi:hypothetical protein
MYMKDNAPMKSYMLGFKEDKLLKWGIFENLPNATLHGNIKTLRESSGKPYLD